MDYVPTQNELIQAFHILKESEIPKIPEVVLELQKETSKPEPDLAAVGKILETDIALSGLALKTINSAMFGLSREIRSIQQATILLGLRTLEEVILVSALRQTLGESTPFHNMIWRSSLGCAQGAKALAFAIDGVSQEIAYIAGLFHNAGAILLENKYPDYAQLYSDYLSCPVSLLRKEMSTYGTSHTVIGYLLAKNWKLPDKVCLAIYNSHISNSSGIPDQELRALIAVLKITENITSRMFYDSLEFGEESNLSLADAYMEIIVDDDALVTMREKIEKAVFQ